MILGISGLAGSGKDTAADFLVKNHGFVKVSLADPLKRICREVFAFTDEQLWGPSANRNAPDKRYVWKTKPMYAGDGGETDVCGSYDEYLTPRHALQTLGTEWGRECYQNVWIDYALRVAQQLTKSSQLYYTQQKGVYPRLSDMPVVRGVVIPDCRFKNEILAIHSVGGKVMRLRRDDSGLTGNAALHLSEAEQQGIPDTEFDYIINNNGPLAELEKDVALSLLSLS